MPSKFEGELLCKCTRGEIKQILVRRIRQVVSEYQDVSDKDRWFTSLQFTALCNLLLVSPSLSSIEAQGWLDELMEEGQVIGTTPDHFYLTKDAVKARVLPHYGKGRFSWSQLRKIFKTPG